MQDGVVGVDLGGTCTKFGLVSEEGTLLAYNAIPTNSSITYQQFFEQLFDQVKRLNSSLDKRLNLKGIGIGAPTGNSCMGTIESASNLDWDDNVPVVSLLEEYTSLPTVLVNDANASAVGELLYGVARGMENFVSITLGTGLGCGIVANGKLVMGQRGHAGEIGHTTVYYDGRPCTCGRQGCLETYVSAPGMVKTVQQLLSENGRASILRNITPKKMDAKNITDAARADDEIALEAFEYTGKILGLKLADIVACMNPEAIVVSGGLAKAGDLILEPAKENMEAHVLEIFKDEVDILPSSLTEKNAAILGAAASIWQELEKKRTHHV
ncbi:ROK family protein [Fodinibius halophilus]|uniref:ROK family protein n=1 Tax=Fodinibius halophilus TaxID=1736908 RepID=A0A6M1T2V3_9BACT|nr:ROK family protein [Fodinibius halophilus]NGP88367.1 ROK family protein [Fodinibius halophilus]